MQIDEIDKEIRRAVQAEALAYEAPLHLAESTMAHAKSLGKPSFWGRLKDRLKGIEISPHRRSHKWVWTVAAAASVAAFFAVGSASLRGPLQEDSRGLSSPGIGDSRQRAVPPGPDRCEGGNCGARIEGPTNAASTGSGDGGSEGGSLEATSGSEPSLSQSSATHMSAEVPQQTSLAAGTPAGQSRPIAGSQSQAQGLRGGPPTGQAIVRSGEMEVRVPNRLFGARWAAANEIAAKYGGLVAGSSAEQVKGRLSRGTITVRVPADKLDSAIKDFGRLGTVSRLTTSATDVSAQLADYDARLRAAQAQEVQLLEILNDAKSVSDSLQVRGPLADVRREVETIQAEKARVTNQVQLATMTVSLFEPQAKPEGPWAGDGRLEQAWTKAKAAAATTLGGFLVAAGYALPLGAILLVAWFGLRLRRRVI